ncbi:MAG TPA: stage II sporulation protein M [Burkholderiales bacterium]|nr:stage II sporulation protein M [Burkholderiales bacterium]
MRQAIFEARHRPDWLRFEAWLDRHEKLRKRELARPAADALPDAEVPQAYRHLCQHLALARDRQYSPDLVDRLNRLALRGHHLLYGARGRRGAHALAFVLGGFPALVREERAAVIAAACLFFAPLLLLVVALQSFPDFIYYLVPPEALAKFQEMYNPSNRRHGMRDADDNVAMFGFYIWNNVKIGFQTFAGGMAFGLGSIYYLVSNGVLIGAIAGYVTQVGYGTPFWSFVSGHSAMELVAIVISGAAGLRLGGALVAPGQQSRKAALVAAAKPAVRLMYGAAGMFLIAAFVEAFWSPLTAFPPVTKYVVGAILWGFVVGYFLFAGRGRAA